MATLKQFKSMLRIFRFLLNIKIPAGFVSIGDPTPKYLAVLACLPTLGNQVLSQIIPASSPCNSHSSSSPSTSAWWQGGPASPYWQHPLPSGCGIRESAAAVLTPAAVRQPCPEAGTVGPCPLPPYSPPLHSTPRGWRLKTTRKGMWVCRRASKAPACVQLCV